MNKSTLHNYCNGVFPRNLLQLKSLADFLETPFAELIFGEETAKKQLPGKGTIEGRYEIEIRKIETTNESKR